MNMRETKTGKKGYEHLQVRPLMRFEVLSGKNALRIAGFAPGNAGNQGQ